MTDAIIVTVDSVRSRASTQETLLTLAVPQEHAPMIAKFLGMIHQHVAVAFAEVDQNTEHKADKWTPEEIEKMSESSPQPFAINKIPAAKPYGKEAAELYRLGWFFNQKVLEAIGTDEEYLVWLRSQPCAASHLGDCEGDVVAAHVRRIANGAGTGIKPTFSAIPLCSKHHALQHSAGESAIAPR